MNHKLHGAHVDRFPAGRLSKRRRLPSTMHPARPLQRHARRVMLLLVLLLSALVVAALPIMAKDGDITIEGAVVSAPSSVDGVGRYVVDDGTQSYAVDTDSETEFDTAPPLAGDQARIEGQEQEDGVILATRIRVLAGEGETEESTPDTGDSEDTPEPEMSETPEPDESETPEPDESETPEPEESETPEPEESETPEPEESETPEPEESETPEPTPGGDDDDGFEDYEDPCLDLDEDRWNGVVVSRPDPAPVGQWVIQVDSETQLSVAVSAQTRVDYGVPGVNEWVEIRGRLRDAESCVVDATRLRPDEFRGGEIVVRLTSSDIVSQTVASDYGMLASSTLLESGSIYLFTIVDDDVLDDDDDEQEIVDLMQADSRVAWAEFNYVNSVPVGEGYKTWGWGGVDPTGYQNQSALAQVKLAAAQTEYGGAGVIVAVLDTGIDLEHPAFVGRILQGRDVVDDDALPLDEGFGLAWGHGTHVSGVVALSAPDALLLPVRVLDSNGRGNMFTLAYAIEWAVAHGADVINLSVGAESDSRVLRDAIAEAVSQGVVVVAAAGNLNTSAVQYPAAYPDVLSVTAVDGEGVKASFASYGRDWVDIAAPGVGITSTVVGPQGSGYASWSGTSMATPFVSGAAALTLDALPTASPAQVTTTLMDSAVNIDALNRAYAGQLGSGLLDVAAALNVQVPVDPGVEQRKVFLPTITLR